MKTYLKKFIFVALFLCLFISAATAQTEFVRVLVVDVHDGDTITVTDATKRRFKIRIIGIDAPELKQNFGEKSRRELKKILGRDKKNIIVKTFGLDLYNRILAQVFVGKADVGLELLQNGWAWFYNSRQLPQNDLKQYKSAFENAKATKIGIFADEKAEQPKDFRL